MCEIPTDRTELIKLLSKLLILLKSNNYKEVLSADTEKQNKERNRYADAIIAKYEEAFVLYSSLYPNDTMLKHYGSALKSAKRMKYVRKYSLLFAILVPLLILILSIAIFGD